MLRVLRVVRLALPLVALCAIAMCGGSDTSAAPSPTSQPAAAKAPWQLSWSDEFDGADGSRPDPSRWVYDFGGDGWGNQELETYTDRPENSRIERGALVITARAEKSTGADGIPRDYTSARLKTLGRFSQAYGRFEARIKIPRGQGIWPAFWMMGVNIDSRGWPDDGEIDVMENIGREPTTVHGTVHGPGYSGADAIGMPFQSPDGRPFADDYHLYAIEWEPSEIRWYADNHHYQTRRPSDLPANARWVFDHEMFMLLNVAVGGSWPGNPDQTTVFPQQMLVDYVRVYRR